ncbi:MAG: ATP-binding protein [Paracoccaceae bacterium]
MNLIGFKRITPTIWGQLMLMIGSIVAIVWMVLAVSIFFFWQTRQDYNALTQAHIPQLALSSELAEGAAELAALATAIVSADPSENSDLRARLSVTTDELSRILQSPFLTEAGPENTLLQNDIKIRLAEILTGLEKRHGLQAATEALVEQLRWLNVDIQDEIDPVLGDFSFNVEVATESLARSGDPSFRVRLSRQITAERAARDLIFRIGTEASTTTTLLLQSTVASAPSQLAQYVSLTADSLSRLNADLARLPDKTEYLTLRQSAALLNDLANNDLGILVQRDAWLANQISLLDDLDHLQMQFAQLQTNLSETSRVQRVAVANAIQLSARRAAVAMWWLVGLTIMSGLAGAVVLFGYIRRGVIRPMHEITTAMQEIARGAAPAKLPAGGDDEIGHMAAAVLAFQHSIDAREQAIEQLHQTQAELVQAGKMAALGNLSAGISHELNQPLAAIQQRLHLLSAAEKSGEQDKIVRQIERISGLVERMTNTIKHLKRFARRSEYKRESLSLGPLLANAVAILRGKIDQPEITLTIAENCNLATVLGDQILIEQVLVNILSNAVDAINETGEAGEISISAKHSNGFVILNIADTGIGLVGLTPDEAIDPFVTTKDIGEGLGLGLSISYNIAKDMGGDLRLTPHQPSGMRAIFTLVEGNQE